jgi:hypothetical protein
VLLSIRSGAVFASLSLSLPRDSMLSVDGMDRQTETGSIVVTPFPGAIQTKPGSATVPFFGIEPVILDATTGVVRTFPSSSFLIQI